MASQELYQYIADYLNDRLSGKERMAFEQKLETDSDFRSEFDLHRDLQKQMSRNAEMNQMKRLIDNILHQPNQRHSKQKKLLMVILAILLLALGYILYL